MIKKLLIKKLKEDIASWETLAKWGSTTDKDVYEYAIEYAKELLEILRSGEPNGKNR